MGNAMIGIFRKIVKGIIVRACLQSRGSPDLLDFRQGQIVPAQQAVKQGFRLLDVIKSQPVFFLPVILSSSPGGNAGE